MNGQYKHKMEINRLIRQVMEGAKPSELEGILYFQDQIVEVAKLVAAKEREKFFTKHEAEELLDATDFSYQNNVTVEMYRKVMAIAERESKV